MLTTDVIVLGAGAAGLMCAIVAGRRGRRVLVLDHNAVPGAKLRITGGGRCNATNLDVQPDHYVSHNPRFCASALARFAPADVTALLDHHGIGWHLENGTEVFCNHSARDVVTMLLADAAEARVDLRLSHTIGQVTHDGLFSVVANGETFRAPSLVIATGGLSYPSTGATGVGYDLARQFGLHVIEPRPGLAGFVLAGADQALGALAGIAIPACGTVGRHTCSGDLLFTHKGFSGPLGLRLSLYWKPGMPVTLNLVPGVDAPGLVRAARTGSLLVRAVLQPHLPKRLVEAVVPRTLLDTPAARFSNQNMAALATMVHACRVTPGRIEGYAKAEVTIGGIDTADLSSKTMEARALPGLFCIGEVVDVTGQLGGYNLHWAWASGHAAGLVA
jgi:hypothetical protein